MYVIKYFYKIDENSVSGVITSIFIYNDTCFALFKFFFFFLLLTIVADLNLPSASKHPYHKPKMKFSSSALL